MRQHDVINASERHAGGMPPSEHADWVIDLGPGGGVNGGEIVVAGTPEVVASEPKSFTGQYLKPLLERSTRAPAQAGTQTLQRSRRKAPASVAKSEIIAAE